MPSRPSGCRGRRPAAGLAAMRIVLRLDVAEAEEEVARTRRLPWDAFWWLGAAEREDGERAGEQAARAAPRPLRRRRTEAGRGRSAGRPRRGRASDPRHPARRSSALASASGSGARRRSFGEVSREDLDDPLAGAPVPELGHVAVPTSSAQRGVSRLDDRGRIGADDRVRARCDRHGTLRRRHAGSGRGRRAPSSPPGSRPSR